MSAAAPRRASGPRRQSAATRSAAAHRRQQQQQGEEDSPARIKYSVSYFNWAVSDSEEDDEADHVAPTMNVTLALNRLRLGGGVSAMNKKGSSNKK